MSTLDPLAIRRALGRGRWRVPEPFGPDGWRFTATDVGGHQDGDLLVSVGPSGDDDTDWIHASLVLKGRMPSYEDMCEIHRAVFGDRWAYHVFAPSEHHVNIHAGALHLWGRFDGVAALPNFGVLGTI